MIEVMIAFAVLTIGVLSSMSFIGTLTSVANSSLARETRTITSANLVNLLSGTNWDEIARNLANRAWGLPRFTDGGGSPGMTIADLVTMGVVHPESGHLEGDVTSGSDSALTNLRFFVEFYRAIPNQDSNQAPIASQPGLWQTQSASSSVTSVAPPTTAASIVPAPALGLADSTQLTQGNPVVVRVLLRDLSDNRTLVDTSVLVATPVP